MIKKFVSLSALICLLHGCGIFDLKDPEVPFAGPVTEDPLNIGDILGVVRESALTMDYVDYFTSNVRFENLTMFRLIEGRNEVIHMLNRLRTQAQFVEWQTERGERRFEGNRQIIEDVPYTVYLRGGETRTGFADFHISREPDWRISYWKDMPGGVPFFEP
ncbi:MAG: hypothetical protein LBC70_00945 [Chitinispirillales bacterium]|jgi:hypothetical protein|nr:hypothetical protein [Chitinispirillales bacterium]